MSVLEMLTLCFVQAKLSHFQAHDAASATYDAIVNGRNNEGEVDEEEERFFLGGLFRPRAPNTPEVQAALDALRFPQIIPAATPTAQSAAELARRTACVRAGNLSC